MTASHILVVDDEPDIRQLLKEILEDEGYAVSVAEDAESARRARLGRRPDLVLLDIWMPDLDGISLLKEWREGGGLPCPVVMMSGHGTVETAVEATRLGAWDFIEKPISLAKLLLTVEHALSENRLQRDVEGLRRQLPTVAEPAGSSEAMRDLRARAARLARHDTWILIRGEPGTGKETVARYLHSLSARKDRPLVEMRPGSIARENTERELFGSERDGNPHYGRLEQATGGTLLIDEVADMDAGIQSRLLSALETGKFLRIGGEQPVGVDVRVIATSSRDLERAVRDGDFREELYYQLNVVPLHVPPLRERGDDIPELLHFYVDFFCDRENLDYRRFSTAVQNRLRNYGWPGNVRELRNLVQRLLILGAGREITLDELDGALNDDSQPAHAPDLPAGVYDLPLREARERFEHDYLVHQLRLAGGSVGKLAKAVGMERTHLYRKLRALDIDPRKAAGQTDH